MYTIIPKDSFLVGKVEFMNQFNFLKDNPNALQASYLSGTAKPVSVSEVLPTIPDDPAGPGGR